MSRIGRAPGFEENVGAESEPVLARRVSTVREDAERAGHLGLERIAVTLDVDAGLLETLKRRTGLDETAAVIEFAMAHVVLDSDFALAARLRTWQAIDDDLPLDDIFPFR